MYNINFDKYFNLINWSCVYWGIQEQLIGPKNAVTYANKVIENNPQDDTPEIIELLIIDKADKDDILTLIEKMFPMKKDLETKKASALRTLRLILLLEIKNDINDNQDLLNKIENIYADFNYPTDMEGFISYMPSQDSEYDVSKHSPQENMQHLVDKFNIFIDKEFNAVTTLNNIAMQE